jgi:hypothetical protein
MPYTAYVHLHERTHTLSDTEQRAKHSAVVVG